MISTQILNEVASVCLRTLKMPWEEFNALLLAVKAACTAEPRTGQSHKKTIELAKLFNLPLYDANIVANAPISGVQLLFSENMQGGLLIDSLFIQNPFTGASSRPAVVVTTIAATYLQAADWLTRPSNQPLVNTLSAQAVIKNRAKMSKKYVGLAKRYPIVFAVSHTRPNQQKLKIAFAP